MSSSYLGQWSGNSDNGSIVLVNIDQQNGNLTGRVSILQSMHHAGGTLELWSWSYFEAKLITDETIEGTVGVPSLHKRYGDLLSESELSELKTTYGIETPTNTKFTGERLKISELEIHWESDYPSGLKLNDKVVLKKEKHGSSKLVHEEMNWDKFKDFALNQKSGLIGRVRR